MRKGEGEAEAEGFLAAIYTRGRGGGKKNERVWKISIEAKTSSVEKSWWKARGCDLTRRFNFAHVRTRASSCEKRNAENEEISATLCASTVHVSIHVMCMYVCVLWDRPSFALHNVFQIKVELQCFDRGPCFERGEIFEGTLSLSSGEKFSRREHFNRGIVRKKRKNPNTRGFDLKHSWLSIRLWTERKSAVPAVITHVHNEPRIVQTFFYHSNALITVQPVKLYKIRIEKKT